MALENINQEKSNKVKKAWKAPEVIDLDIKEETKNAGAAGPSAPDGGPGFIDYNS